MTKLIGICGGSGSGKTTLAKQLHELLKGESSLLAMDDYYKPIAVQQKDTNGFVNFDLPSALDIHQFIKDLEALKAGSEIRLKKYDFNERNKPQAHQSIVPKQYLITEGIFLLCEPKVLELLDFVIYVDAPESIMLERRLARDKKERDIQKETILYQWNNHFMPAYQAFVLPYKTKANLVVDGQSEELANLIINQMA